ncbi:MAG: methyltransferase domain-containing protein [Saccharofermentans sp.]|nr:methyltransferase domain-containing protein [Saccharofermentans sp.]
MSDAIKNYRSMVDQPWGRMFYELIYKQLDVSDCKKLKILDFGAGFCITADHYAKSHDVTAVEPSDEMRALRVGDNPYTLVGGGIDYIRDMDADSFDLVICHNVLEYADDKEGILKQLVRVTKPGGILSVVKHNLYGRVMATAVMSDDPKTALSLLDQGAENSMFGKRDVYSNEWITDLLNDEMTLIDTYGIRTFFGLSSNNDIKYTDDWYQSMLELETKACSMDEYRKVAFFNHLIFAKKQNTEM